MNHSPGLHSEGSHAVTEQAGASVARLTLSQSGLLAPLIGLLFGGLSRRYVTMESEGLRRRAEESGE